MSDPGSSPSVSTLITCRTGVCASTPAFSSRKETRLTMKHLRAPQSLLRNHTNVVPLYVKSGQIDSGSTAEGTGAARVRAH